MYGKIGIFFLVDNREENKGVRLYFRSLFGIA